MKLGSLAMGIKMVLYVFRRWQDLYLVRIVTITDGGMITTVNNDFRPGLKIGLNRPLYSREILEEMLRQIGYNPYGVVKMRMDHEYTKSKALEGLTLG